MTNQDEWKVSAAQLRKSHGFSEPKTKSNMKKNAEETAELASEILHLARNTLLINLRFLESAFVRFVPGRDIITGELATDGQFLYYNSVHICRQFQKGRQFVVRDYLHLVLHCLYRHLFTGKKLNGEIWDLACDIAVEHLITGLKIPSLYVPREEEQAWVIKELEASLPRLTAERIYRYFVEKDLSATDCRQLRKYFYADDHSIWHNKPELISGQGENEQRMEEDSDADENMEQENSENSNLNDSDSDQSEQPDSGETSDSETRAASEDEKDGTGSAGGDEKKDLPEQGRALAPEELERKWKEIAERIQVDLDTFSNSYGESAGNMMQTLTEVNREKVNYGEFLRRFAVLGENIEVNDDEFDYIFYTYGMEKYGRMPLIEPLEYKEVKKVREFVIALDTSESVSGDLVQKFVTKTWNILKQTENFFTKVNVHILQCGAKVEEDVKITSEEEFDAYMRRMVLRGFGGTDFRPVFDHVNALIRQHEFRNLKGILYFTDGYGTFPAMPPEYETAFVFLDEGRNLPDIPPWVIRLLLTEEDIRLF
ncbi:MAG: VWA-like domain-containing protein [Brotaphodocola sp.]